MTKTSRLFRGGAGIAAAAAILLACAAGALAAGAEPASASLGGEDVLRTLTRGDPARHAEGARWAGDPAHRHRALRGSGERRRGGAGPRRPAPQEVHGGEDAPHGPPALGGALRIPGGREAPGDRRRWRATRQSAGA